MALRNKLSSFCKSFSFHDYWFFWWETNVVFEPQKEIQKMLF